MSLILDVLVAAWQILVEAAPFMLFGFVAAGLLKAFVPPTFINRHLGKGGRGSVVKAALVGAPLPLCSCSVLPAAAGLREQGAGKGAVTSFLIATPETGVDSISVSFALLDPFMAVLRPVAAVVTAVLTGLGVDFFDKEPPKPKQLPKPLFTPLDTAQPLGGSCSGGACGCSAKTTPVRSGVLARARQGLGQAFGEMLADIGGWFLLGVLVAGLITALLPGEALSHWLGQGPWPMLAALALAVPLYVCDTASTPLAAALVLKGLSPGAALVFLLAGPATNVATISVVTRLMGRRAAVLYVGGIVLTALAFGLLADLAYSNLGLSTAGWLAGTVEEEPGLLGSASAVLLLFLLGRAMWLGSWKARLQACVRTAPAE